MTITRIQQLVTAGVITLLAAWFVWGGVAIYRDRTAQGDEKGVSAEPECVTEPPAGAVVWVQCWTESGINMLDFDAAELTCYEPGGNRFYCESEVQE